MSNHDDNYEVEIPDPEAVANASAEEATLFETEATSAETEVADGAAPDDDTEAPTIQFDDTPECILPMNSEASLVNVSDPRMNRPEKTTAPADLPVNPATMYVFDRVTEDLDDNTFNPDPIWASEIKNALDSVNVFSDLLEKAATRASQWAQRITVDGRHYGPSIPKIAQPRTDNELLSGMAALMKVQALTSTGRRVTWPMWSSGVWLSMRAPILEELVELERRIVESKSILGRTTHGFIFSNQGAYVESLLIDFALNHVFDSSLKNWSVELLRNTLKHDDLQALAIATAATIYPNGFNYAQPCMANPANCNHVARDLINPMKLAWTDLARLSEKQRKFMAVSQTTKRELKEILEYQEEFTALPCAVREYENGAIRLVFRVPTMQEAVTSGMEWITTLEQKTEETFGVTLRGKNRDDYLAQVASSARAVLYASWIKEIQIPDEETEYVQLITDPESIMAALKAWSSNSELTEQLFADVLEFINKSIVTLVGIPNYACPACNKWHYTAQGAISRIVPVDAVSVFFRLQQLLIQ